MYLQQSYNPHTHTKGNSRKRSRPIQHNAIPRATLVTSLLWLVAFTSTHPFGVKAFVVASDRHNAGHAVTKNNIINNHKQPQHQPLQPLVLSPEHDHHHDKQKLFSSVATALPAPDLSSLVKVPTDLEGVLDFELLSSPLGLIKLLSSRDGQPAAKVLDEEEVLEWAGRYTSVDALREHFGGNQNKLWGDLQASTARRLYKTLLPRALLELSKIGQLQPQDLAPLAYQARVAAKLYARERCTVPARIAATLFDGFRQWIKYGKFQGHGMTYDQLWQKYAEKILHETESTEHRTSLETSERDDDYSDHHDDEECSPFESDCEDLSEQVCLKILERACVSNEGVDSLVLTGQDWSDDTFLNPEQRQLLERIRYQLEKDMYQLLLPPGSVMDEQDDEHEHPTLPVGPTTRDRLQRGKFKLVKGLAKQRRFWKLRHQKKLLAKAMAAAREELESKKEKKHMAWLSLNNKHKNQSRLHEESDSEDDPEQEDDEEVLKP
ncbi:expressed unknown protein [Seminavis robusta]|uniref:Uncharacterized protein n=1 Tax=Seminavis robusta TaxID=568900 RepID=A0A9N8EHB6_9STRA|nr:expressed unknown protein [Seminavis robusta]|eukprot:Sro1206_g252340.1 n/a (493) ;mRNA; r:3987-5465